MGKQKFKFKERMTWKKFKIKHSLHINFIKIKIKRMEVNKGTDTYILHIIISIQDWTSSINDE